MRLDGSGPYGTALCGLLQFLAKALDPLSTFADLQPRRKQYRKPTVMIVISVYAGRVPYCCCQQGTLQILLSSASAGGALSNWLRW